MSAGPAGTVIVDLDGTLVLGNSFHEFCGRMWRHGGGRARLTLISIAARRGLSRRRDGRQAMKHRVIALYGELAPERAAAVCAATVDACLTQLSGPVLDFVRTHADADWEVVLATAAPAAYAEPLAIRLGFDACLATPMHQGSAADELIGEQKAAAVRGWLDARSEGSAPVAVVTDHPDDLPLMALADELVLQCSGEQRSAIEQRLGRRAERCLDPVEAQDGGGLWLWFDDRPSGPHDAWEVSTILSKHRYALLYTGDGRWARVLPGSSLAAGVRRVACPSPPRTRQRVGVTTQRRWVRDRLRIFH